MSDTSFTSPERGARDVELDLRTLGSALWRRLGLVIALVAMVAGATFLFVSSTPPEYTAEARILIENADNAFTRPLQDLERGDLNSEAVASQAQLIQSRDLARKVVEDLDLVNHPEFDPRAQAPSLTSKLFTMLGLARDPGQRSLEARALDTFYERLTVYPVGESRVIAVRFTAQDRELAARAANALAESYVAMQRAAKIEMTRQASDWLGSEIDGLRGRLAEAEGKVEDFRASTGLYLGANNVTLSAQQLSELNRQLAEVRAQRSQLEARAETIRGLLASGRPIDATTDVLNSSLVQRLQESQVNLQARVAELSSTLLPQHPRMRAINAQLDDLQRQIREEASKVARGLETEAELAQAREASLTEQLGRVKTDAGEVNSQEVRLRALEREAKAERDLLESYLARYREATARESFAGVPADARLISRAAVPNEPSSPSALAVSGAVAVATAILLLGGIVTLELVSGRPFVMPTGSFVVPVATAPAPLVRETSIDDDADGTEFDPDASNLQSIEALAGRLREARLRKGVKRIAFLAQAQDGDRAASCLAATARLLAGEQDRTVMVDADMERAPLSALVKPDAQHGLGDLLAGTVKFSAALFRDRLSRAHVIPAGPERVRDAALVDTPRMDTVLDALSHTYDSVLVHVRAGEDGLARVLVSRCELCVLIGQPDDKTASRLAAMRAKDVMALAYVGDVPSELDHGVTRDNRDEPKSVAA